MNDSTVEAVVDRVVDLLKTRIGLRAEPTVRSRLRRCIRDDAAAHGYGIADYVGTLLTRDDALQSLLNRVTVQETSFFRHPEHFEVLARDLLPTLQAPITLWSAGCANGQEAFSLAMTLDELKIDGSVIATDLSTAALQRTEQASYAQRELTGLSPERLARHLHQTGSNWQINQTLRDRIITLRHNLIEPLPHQVAGCQVVFCRNVLIYFSPEHSRAFLDRLADTLPDAALFLGSAEAIWPVTNRYETVRVGDTFIYSRRPDTAPPSRQLSRRDVPGTPARSADAGPRPLVRPRQQTAAGSAQLTRAGQEAMAVGDTQSAVVCFRKWAYLAPEDALAHLHLGLALEAAGDPSSAQRAYGAARRALPSADPAHIEQEIRGYTKSELLKLLDAKGQVASP
jgi:chemotaxis protein methyltransferase CheR